MGIVIEQKVERVEVLAQELADQAWSVIEAWDGDSNGRQSDEDIESAVRALDEARSAYLAAIEPQVATRPPQDPSGEA